MRSLLSLFERPRATVPAATAVTLAASSRAEHTPTSGLVTVEIAAAADAPTRAVLRVFAEGDRRPGLETRLSLSPAMLSTWVAVHGHLLPNGAAKVRLELTDLDDALLAEKVLTLHVRNEGELAELTRASLRRSGAPLAVDVCDSSVHDYADLSLVAWYDRSPAEIEAHLRRLGETAQATDAEVAALRHFVEEGYLVLPDVVGPDHLQRLNAALDDAVEKKIEGYEWGASQRLHDLHNHYPAVHELRLHSTILRMLRLIFGAPARPAQSLTYVFGSEQKLHQDSIALTSFPQGRMCGVWTALEDIQPDSGELVVFPKSHRLPRVCPR